MTSSVEQILAEFLTAREQGLNPSVELLLESHPEYHAEIHEYFALNDEFAGLFDACSRHRPLPEGEPQFPLPFGAYSLLAELGSGGMGIVFEAMHRPTGRLVALKMLRGGRFSSQADQSRFHRESSAMMQLDHPGIVTVFVVDTCDGHPFFTMQLMPGGTLRERFATNRADCRTAANIVAQLADAVQYAHQRGLIHRDIKPSNILFDHENRVYLADFGLAKWLSTSEPQPSQSTVTGTPGYMAPEQHALPQSVITTATDVYGLGGILHFLLIGLAPSDSITSGHFKHIPPDLDAIRRKALAPKEQDRYSSAIELKHDLDRYLNGQTVKARIPSWAERGARFAWRNPVLSVLLALTLFAFVCAGYFAWRDHSNSRVLNQQLNQTVVELKHSLKAVSEQRETLEDINHTLTVLQACQLYREGKLNSASDLLRASSVQRQPKSTLLERILYRFVGHYQTLNIGERGINALAVHPDGRVIATVNRHGVRIMDVETGRTLKQWPINQSAWYGMEYRPDGHAIAIWHQCENGEHTVQVFSPTGDLLHECTLKWINLDQMTWSEDQSHLVLAGRHQPRQTVVTAWNPTANTLQPYKMHTGETITHLCRLPTKRAYAAAINAEIWIIPDDPTAEPRPVDLELNAAVVSLDAAPDGRLACITAAGNIVLLDDTLRHAQWKQHIPVSLGKHDIVWTDHARTITAFVNSERGTERHLFNAKTGNQVEQELFEINAEYLVRRSPDMTQIFLCSDSGLLQRWRQPQRPCIELKGHTGEVWTVAFSPDGKTLATAGDDATIRLWDMATQREIAVLVGHTALVMSVAFSPDGGKLYSSGWDQTVRVWDVATHQMKGQWQAHTGPITNLALPASGKQIVTRSRDATIKVWDTESHELIRTFSSDARRSSLFAMSTDGQRLLAGTTPTHMKIWDTATWETMSDLEMNTGRVDCGAFTPTGDMILGKEYGRFEIRKFTAGTTLISHAHLTEPATRLAVSPDDRYFLVGNSADNAKERVILFDRHNGRPLLGLPHASTTFGLAFSPCSRFIATGSHDGLVRLWGLPD